MGHPWDAMNWRRAPHGFKSGLPLVPSRTAVSMSAIKRFIIDHIAPVNGRLQATLVSSNDQHGRTAVRPLFGSSWPRAAVPLWSANSVKPELTTRG